MADPKRLMDGELDQLSRSLLEAGRRDSPTPAARRRAARALGIGGGAAVVAIASKAAAASSSAGSSGVPAAGASMASSAAAAAAGGAAASAATVAGMATLAKIAVVAVVAGFVGVSSTAILMGRSDGLGARPEEEDSSPAVLRARALPEASPPSSLDDRIVRDATDAARLPTPAPVLEAGLPREGARSARRQGPSLDRENAPDLLTEELRLVDGARAALSAGRVDEALQSLRLHRRRFHGGALAEEAMALHIEAAAAAGELDTVRELHSEFETRFPGSPYRDRVARILGEEPLR